MLASHQHRIHASTCCWQRPRRVNLPAASSSSRFHAEPLRSQCWQPGRRRTRSAKRTQAASEPVVRFALYGTACTGAGIAFAFACTQLAAGLANAPNALPVQQSLEGIGIDVAAFGIFAFLLRRDLQARDKQLERLQREEKLGALQVELGNKRTVRLSQLRSFARVVVVAGTPSQVAESMRKAEQLKEQIEERGLLIVPLPIFNDSNDSVQMWRVINAACGHNLPAAISEVDGNA